MTADAAHVAAVAEALHPSHDWGACNCRAIATVAVETLTPLIRAQVAAEILAVNVRHLSREYAARIAEGTP
jgi:hypothetical protein